MESPSDLSWRTKGMAWLMLFSLAGSVLSIYVPFNLRDPLLLVALIWVYRERRLIQVDAGLKRVALLMLSYIVIFTLFSTDWGRSVKGAYDMARGMLVFFVAYLLAEKLRNPEQSLVFTALVAVLILGSFMFPWMDGPDHLFYGYHMNPNNSAVTLIIYLMLSIPMLEGPRRRIAWLIGGIGIAAGLYLLVLANSRGALLGLFGAGMVILFLQPRVSARARMFISLALALAFAGVLLFANFKGGSLSLRDQIWLGLLHETASTHPWIGFGLNRAKDVMTDIGLPTLTAHNLFLEIFVSSGVVGLVFMLFVMGVLVRHLMSFDYRRSPQFYMGVGGLVAYLLMAQFDLKLSSFRFMATISLFLGLLYSQRISKRES